MVKKGKAYRGKDVFVMSSDLSGGISQVLNQRDNFQKEFSYQSIDSYYEILRKESSEIYLWETEYIHILDNHMDLIQWYKSTGMKGYLHTLPTEKLKKDFENITLENCKREYKFQNDGKVLFSFNRLFFMALKTL